MNNFSNKIDTLCYGSIYSHIKDKNSGGNTPDRYAINRGRQYVMIAILMYLNTPSFLLSTFHAIGNNVWLIYSVATFIVVFPLGYSILNNRRMARICEKFSQENNQNLDRANKMWLRFYYLAFICFFISVFMKLIIP